MQLHDLLNKYMSSIKLHLTAFAKQLFSVTLSCAEYFGFN
jgi:hypothetical protein